MEKFVVSYNDNPKFYDLVHKWLRYHYGSARRCESIDCTGKSNVFQYALRRNFAHAKKRSHYLELCASCHRLYDQRAKWHQKQAASIRGRKHTDEHKANISKGLKLAHGWPSAWPRSSITSDMEP